MYFVRVEHDGFDEKPHSFEYTHDVADFIRIMLRSGDMGDKVTVTVWEKLNKPTMSEVLDQIEKLQDRSETLLEAANE